LLFLRIYPVKQSVAVKKAEQVLYPVAHIKQTEPD